MIWPQYVLINAAFATYPVCPGIVLFRANTLPGYPFVFQKVVRKWRFFGSLGWWDHTGFHPVTQWTKEHFLISCK